MKASVVPYSTMFGTTSNTGVWALRAMAALASCVTMLLLDHRC